MGESPLPLPHRFDLPLSRNDVIPQILSSPPRAIRLCRNGRHWQVYALGVATPASLFPPLKLEILSANTILVVDAPILPVPGSPIDYEKPSSD